MSNVYNDNIVVLRIKDWQTADKYVVGFTKNHGKVSFIAYGAKYPKSVNGRLIQAFSHLQVELYEGSSVDKLKACESLGQPFKLDIQQIAYVALAAEVTELLTEYKAPHEEIFELFLKMLQLIEEKNPRLVVLAYLCQLLNLIGIGPIVAACVSCGQKLESDGRFSNEHGGFVCQECSNQGEIIRVTTAELWQNLNQLDFENPQPFSVKGGDLMELEKILHRYLLYHTDKELKTLDFLAQLTKQS